LPIDPSSILRRLDDERRTLARCGEMLEQTPGISRVVCADRSRHTILFSALDSKDADRVIAQEAARYRNGAISVEWKVYSHDSPADLVQKLHRGGFEIGPRESVLVLDLHDPHDWLKQRPLHRVERVATRAMIELYRQTAEQALGKDYRFTASELWHGLSNGSTEHLGYLGFSGPVPVSFGRLYTHAQSVFGGLYGGATLPDFRRAGFYRSVVAARAQDARQMGARFLIVDAAPASCRILKRLGFVEIARTWPCLIPKTGRRVSTTTK
jgi:hypothetical protein